MVQATSPIYGNVAFLAIESCSAFHRPTGANATEFEKAVKHRTVISDVVLSLLSHVAVHVVRCDPPKKLNVLVGVELCHLVDNRGLRALDKHVA